MSPFDFLGLCHGGGSSDEFEGSGPLRGHRAGAQAHHGAIGCGTVASVSVRHVKRLPRAVRDQGTAGITSRRRGVPSSTAANLDSLQRYASEHGRLVAL